ncbi:hypothetical protein HELRODRAFT_177698 [Helobdella robusta]|uniref:PARG helical domain-containing protein n=1 Tax=Helobdella robusta TaxID=6412 RepID=T1FC35_HELRO|nr:hypothetical protein HELRODRAFT_177698 [Helobdella robusta]ESN97643.1 hypothetical protein HELRODRAFT_177698 [Helobdella robusta]
MESTLPSLPSSASRHIIFPWHLDNWMEIKNSLTELKSSSSLLAAAAVAASSSSSSSSSSFLLELIEEFVWRLEKIHDLVTNDEKPVHPNNIFEGLKYYLHTYLPSSSSSAPQPQPSSSSSARQQSPPPPSSSSSSSCSSVISKYFCEIFPHVIDRLLAIDSNDYAPFSIPDGNAIIKQPRTSIPQMLACCLLGLMPHQQQQQQLGQQQSQQHQQLGQQQLGLQQQQPYLDFTFKQLYSSVLGPNSLDACQRLQCIFQYFELLLRNVFSSDGEDVVYARQSLRSLPSLSAWLNSNNTLCTVCIVEEVGHRVRDVKNGVLVFLTDDGLNFKDYSTKNTEVCLSE